MPETFDKPDNDVGRNPDGNAARLRLGIVPYLNVQPLIWAIENPERAPELHAEIRRYWPGGVEIRSAVPSKLAAQLAAGEFDAAIAPIVEAFLLPELNIAEGVAIGCHGAVGSVLVVHEKPWDEIRTIARDPSSLTSNNLLRVLVAADGHGAHIVDAKENPTTDAQLVIGDPALVAAKKSSRHRDLGQWWFEATSGMPFVFAAWLIPPRSATPTLVTMLQMAKDTGFANLETVAEETAAQFGKTPEAALRYFRENLNFDLGLAQKQAIAKFRSLAFPEDCASPLRYLAAPAAFTRQIP